MKKRILIVDDIAFNIELEEKIIKSLMDELNIEMTIESAATVTEALNKVSNDGFYDAMIIDINLPDGSGIDIAKAARNKNPETRLAALTIYPSKYEKERGYFDLFLKKPIMPESYKQNIVRLLQLP